MMNYNQSTSYQQQHQNANAMANGNNQHYNQMSANAYQPNHQHPQQHPQQQPQHSQQYYQPNNQTHQNNPNHQYAQPAQTYQGYTNPNTNPNTNFYNNNNTTQHNQNSQKMPMMSNSTQQRPQSVNSPAHQHQMYHSMHNYSQPHHQHHQHHQQYSQTPNTDASSQHQNSNYMKPMMSQQQPVAAASPSPVAMSAKRTFSGTERSNGQPYGVATLNTSMYLQQQNKKRPSSIGSSPPLSVASSLSSSPHSVESDNGLGSPCTSYYTAPDSVASAAASNVHSVLVEPLVHEFNLFELRELPDLAKVISNLELYLQT